MNKIVRLTAIILMSLVAARAISGCKKPADEPKKEEKQAESSGVSGKIGMQAPPLSIAQWVKGSPVDIAAGKGKKIFVVEFWATWCPPCKVTIPHLTETQKKFASKDVVIVGITDEDAKAIKEFLSQMGTNMEYNVAIDDNGKTSKAYMEAFGIDTIPHAFIVDKSGKIVWQGNPLEGFDEALESVVNGSFSIEKEIKKNLADKKFRDFIDAVEKDDTNKINQIGAELEKLDKEVGGLVKGKEFKTEEMRKLVKFSMLMSEYRNALMSGKPESEADEIAKKAAELTPKEVNFEEIKNNLKLQKNAIDYFQAMTGGADDETIAKLAKNISDTKCTNSVLLSQISWAILTNEKLKKRDIPLALKLAKSAYENSDAKDEDIVQVYARALFENGQKEDAVKYQKIAVDLCKDKDKKQGFEKVLEEYQKK
ncbi:MAG: TlpA disulfide reductase family protein [Sulfolobaceae archaeon]